MTPDFFDRHANKIERALDGCWHWSGSAGRYGFVFVGGRVMSAHRAAYGAAHGATAAVGLVVRHRCDQPLCVNPAHLEIGTFADNTRDMMERGRWSGPPGGKLRGNELPFAKLTAEKVQEIRRRYRPRDPEHGFRALAKEFGVDPAAIRQAYLGKTWGHVQ